MVVAFRHRRAALRSLFALGLFLAQLCHAQSEPLPSWNDGQTKRTIVAFVQGVTKQGGPDFVPLPERVAAFDNDGTLWVEKPLPNEVYFVLSGIKRLAAQDPALRERQPFKAALEGDSSYFREAGAKAVLELLLATHSNMTQEQFASAAREFIETGRHPTLGRPYAATAYRPMLELLAYLRDNGFQTWMCSGGTADFMRAFAAQTYGIPPEQIIGSVLKRDSRMLDGRRVVWLLPEIDSINDKDMKAVNIDRQIGMRPVFVAGNVGNAGDIAMMEYSKGRDGPSFQLLINHDDEAREFAYREANDFSLDSAQKNGFAVANIKRDWKTVFGDAPTAAR